MKIFQYSCKESNKVDLRQANAVLRKTPDVIIFEAPSEEKTPSSKFNKFTPDKKPLKDVKEYQKMLLHVSKRYKWVKSDISVYNNIVKLWESGHDIKLYNVDAKHELLKLSAEYGWCKTEKPYRKGTYFSWWVFIYLRERVMVKHISKIFDGLPQDAIVLMFMQKFHWLNVQFQLNNNNKDIFNYYFGKFDKVSLSNINRKVEDIGILALSKFWKKYSGFTKQS